MFCVLFDDRQDAGRDDAMGPAEIVIDLCAANVNIISKEL